MGDRAAVWRDRYLRQCEQVETMKLEVAHLHHMMASRGWRYDKMRRALATLLLDDEPISAVDFEFMLDFVRKLPVRLFDDADLEAKSAAYLREWAAKQTLAT